MVRAAGVAGVLDEEALAASRAACLARRPPGAAVWVFGYGSLIWNPCIRFVERRVVRVFGWHRRFCLWTTLGRGTPDRPGLVLGLERGGSCLGVAFRIAEEEIESELDIVWRREMVTAAYRPIWVRARSAEGTIAAIAFAINREHPRYAGRLPEARIVDALATAAGPLGRCCDYLFETLSHLEALGIRDPHLRALSEAVRRRQAEVVAASGRGADLAEAHATPSGLTPGHTDVPLTHS
ncbi:MAG: gamma-glutamylcyclotransferase [Geminicoccaceae bacterium]|nr:gamma-glutamylcyclotransferase [Geminicoccaceae bacterium]MDW8123635.1 gamma-glutamylcyclotransferase [Geminicoccaceae bacterium]